MDILSWIIVGAIAGWLASLIMNTDASMGLVGNIIVGIIGSVIGGFVANKFLNISSGSGISVQSILVALLGSVILLAILKAIRK